MVVLSQKLTEPWRRQEQHRRRAGRRSRRPVSLAVLGGGGTNALALLLVDAQHYGLLIDTVFQGLWLMPLGYLAYKSGLFPKALGVLLVVGGVCYLLDVLAQFLAPDFGPKIATIVVIPSAIAEISMVVYLLVIGVKTVKPVERIPGAAAAGIA